MRFVDEISITVKSGNGGNGCVSFLHSHLNPLSGPDGGNGGSGGNVYFRGNWQLNSLHKFATKKKWTAENGTNGGESLRTGKNGQNLYIDVPLGTVVHLSDEKKTKQVVGDILENGKVLLVANGGTGGFGNRVFASPVNRTPRYAQKGELTEEIDLWLELMIIADVGFLGLPNAGKSTLLNALTNAQAQTGDFEFTTLDPQLGVLKESKLSKKVVVADLPGIIKGASLNKGLGFKFLKHINRCKALIYVIDSNDNDPFASLQLLEDEVSKSRSANALQRQQIVIWNKFDLLSLEKANSIKAKAFQRKNSLSFFISALQEENFYDIVEIIDNIVENTNDVVVHHEMHWNYNFVSSLPGLEVKKLKNSYWKLSGPFLENLKFKHKHSEFSTAISEALDRYATRQALLRSGVKKGDILLIDKNEYFWK